MGGECQQSGEDGKKENKSVRVNLVDTGAKFPILVHKLHIDFNSFCAYVLKIPAMSSLEQGKVQHLSLRRVLDRNTLLDFKTVSVCVCVCCRNYNHCHCHQHLHHSHCPHCALVTDLSA